MTTAKQTQLCAHAILHLSIMQGTHMCRRPLTEHCSLATVQWHDTHRLLSGSVGLLPGWMKRAVPMLSHVMRLVRLSSWCQMSGVDDSCCFSWLKNTARPAQLPTREHKVMQL